jgi:hypothetical protein
MAQSALEQRLVLECLGLRIDVYVNELHATTRMAGKVDQLGGFTARENMRELYAPCKEAL